MKTNKTSATKAPRTNARTGNTGVSDEPKTATRKAKGASSPATAKTAKSPTPLTSARVTKAAANAKKALAPLTSTVAKSPKPAAAKKPKTLVAKPKAAAPDTAAKAAAVTTIEAFIDVGFGNRLTLRGEGAGLSWERGLTMNCLGSAEWVITLEADASTPLSFKFLLNDEHWNIGENYSLTPGKTGAYRFHLIWDFATRYRAKAKSQI